ncbi:NCS1 family nucleobase:cation symporter-1 [Desulfovibrio sp. UCD-KL4C]|uniref:NCS1 family nucleobase:cation symporter-1 n=1 Tax=Desulfovibrio sp. UCD-KL4C TaxID=2578120 RepID=UPI0025BEFC91|nr:NCS1 family nucleobase:cation symporter-1 [Desulfovibrio sp. UCD-KL4C]
MSKKSPFDETMVELTRDCSGSPLYNEDLAPTCIKNRTWTIYSYIALWMGMSFCVPTYLMAAGFIAAGMSWSQATFTVLLGNAIILIPMLLNGRIGVRYGLSFPVFCRAPFGTKGANIPALARALVACGWFGIQTWIGGAALNALFALVIPGWDSITFNVWISFFFFWFLNIFIVYRGMDAVKKFEHLTAPLLLVFAVGLFVWAVTHAGGFGPIMAQPSKFHSLGEFLPVFIPSLTGCIGFWATLSLNIPDFTRFAKSQKDQIIGQSIGLPFSMTCFALIAILTASATVIIFGKAIWDPVEIVKQFDSPLLVIIGTLCVTLATLTTNIAANVVSPAYDFAHIAPKIIDFKRGALITGIIGIAMMPWKLLSDFGSYIFGWLVGYSALLGPICAIMLADYFIVRKREIDLDQMFVEDGIYSYGNGYNSKAFIAMGAGIIMGLIGLVVPSLSFLYNYAWFVGFFTSGVSYIALMKQERRVAEVY